MRALRRFGVPVYVLRNKIDQAIQCNMEDFEIPPDVTIGLPPGERKDRFWVLGTDSSKDSCQGW